MFGVVGAVDTLRVSETREDIVEDDTLGVESPSFLSFLNSWLLVLLMFLTKLLTRSRFRDGVGDAVGSKSGFEWFEWREVGLSPGIPGDGKGDGEGEENGEDMFFMMPFVELKLLRLRREEGEGSSSGLKDIVGLLEGLPFSKGYSAGDGSGEANGDVKVFTKPFTRSRFREGESGCSEGRPWLFESGEGNIGERTGERNGEGSGMDIEPAEGDI